MILGAAKTATYGASKVKITLSFKNSKAPRTPSTEQLVYQDYLPMYIVTNVWLI